jgi:hypothetical protein
MSNRLITSTKSININNYFVQCYNVKITCQPSGNEYNQTHCFADVYTYEEILILLQIHADQLCNSGGAGDPENPGN